MGTAGSKKAGRRATYIDDIAVRIPRDKLRAALGRFWTPGGEGAKYGVEIPENIAPFYARVGPTSTVRQTTDCPFVYRKNSISVTPNPRVFRAAGGASAEKSFAAFLYGDTLAASKFTPFHNLTNVEFAAFCKLFDIRTSVPAIGIGPSGLLKIPGILNFCVDSQVQVPPQDDGPPVVDLPDVVAALTGTASEQEETRLLLEELKAEGPIAVGELPVQDYDPQADPQVSDNDLLDTDEVFETQPGFDPNPQPVPAPPLDCCDTTFDIMTPFPPAALEYFEAQNNVVFSGLTFSYNYTNDVYNTFAIDPEVAEKDLPNLYTTLTDGDAGRFLRTAKSKIPCDSDVQHLLETTTGHRHLLSTAETTLRLGDGAPYSEFFPYHADLQFTTDRDAEFGDALARRRMDGIMLRRFAQGPDPGDYCNTPPVARTPEKMISMGLSTQVIEADVPSKSVRVKGSYEKASIKEIDFCDWFDKTENCVVSMAIPSALNENARFIRPTPASFTGPIDSADIAVPAAAISMETAAQAERYAEFAMFRMMASEHVNRNFGGYRQLLETGVNHSETVAYKVLKWDAETYKLSKSDPAAAYSALQEIYFSNTQRLDAIHYIDTQVKYNKGYVYEVKALEMVLGTKYKYHATPCSDGWHRELELTDQQATALLLFVLFPALPRPAWAEALIVLMETLVRYRSGAITYTQAQTAFHAWLRTHASSLSSPGFFAGMKGSGVVNDCAGKDIGVEFGYSRELNSWILKIGCPCKEGAIKNHFGEEECNDNVQLPSINVEAISTPCIKIYEVPYFIQQGRLLEHPPVRPLVDLIPYRAVNNQMLINLTNGMGVESQIPIYINPGEQLVVDERLKAENYIRQKVDYRSHPGGRPPAGFEIYRMTSPPKNYQDFAGHLRSFVSTDFDKISRQAADAASFVDDMMPNQKYYYTFRTIGDLGVYNEFGEFSGMIEEARELAAQGAGATEVITLRTAGALGITQMSDRLAHLFSNPTPVYEVELVDDDGAVYLLVRTVDFDILHPPPTHRTMKQLLHVKPNIMQSIVNPRYAEATKKIESGIETILLESEATPIEFELEVPVFEEVPRFESASDVLRETGGKILLGNEAKSLWGKTYKIRLTSKKTCRKLDLNVSFKLNHIDSEQCQSPTIIGVPFDAAEEVS